MKTLNSSSEPLNYECILTSSPSAVLIHKPDSPSWDGGIFEVFPNNPDDPMESGEKI